MEIPGYQILQPVGEGGMAKAFLAVQTSLGRKVVLKLLDTAQRDSAEQVERFVNEGRLVAALSHPHIVTVYDVGIAESCVYLSMEYVEGGDLRQRMGARMPPREALDIVLRIASALQAAHQSGIVHRDVKPANILFRRDGTPLLSDFGIAKKLTLDHDLTSTGVFLGSPNYMAPEQSEAGPIDGRADLYSLGVILFEMLTGTKPYQSDSVIDVIVKHRQAPIPRLPADLAGLQPLIDLMLAKERRDRFRDAESLIHYVRHLPLLRRAPSAALPGNGAAAAPARAAARPETRAPGDRRAARRREAPAPRRMVLVILLLAAAGFYLGIEGAAWWLEREHGQAPVSVDSIAVTPPADVALDLPERRTAGQAPDREVMHALAWLAQASLEDFRLTDPPRDNAYYYYSRLRQIDPSSELARRGLQQTAARFAVLAERALASARYDVAQRYVAVGLSIDPANTTLMELARLAHPPARSLIARVRDWVLGRI